MWAVARRKLSVTFSKVEGINRNMNTSIFPFRVIRIKTDLLFYLPSYFSKPARHPVILQVSQTTFHIATYRFPGKNPFPKITVHTDLRFWPAVDNFLCGSVRHFYQVVVSIDLTTMRLFLPVLNPLTSFSYGSQKMLLLLIIVVYVAQFSYLKVLKGAFLRSFVFPFFILKVHS